MFSLVLISVLATTATIITTVAAQSSNSGGSGMNQLPVGYGIEYPVTLHRCDTTSITQAWHLDPTSGAMIMAADSNSGLETFGGSDPNTITGPTGTITLWLMNEVTGVPFNFQYWWKPLSVGDQLTRQPVCVLAVLASSWGPKFFFVGEGLYPEL